MASESLVHRPAWWRDRGRQAVAAIGVAVVALAVLAWLGWRVWQARAASNELIGGAIAASRQLAPDFALTDQLGRPQQLSGFRGRPVALTFIYTNCPDVCPLIALNMHLAYRALGADAKRVALVAVTVDPERDDVAQVRRFSDARGLTDEWYFLTGPRAQLEAVWRAYGILTRPVNLQGTPVANDPAAVEHAAPTFLIDKQGNVRMLLPVDFSADTLAHNLRVLLREP